MKIKIVTQKSILIERVQIITKYIIVFYFPSTKGRRTNNIDITKNFTIINIFIILVMENMYIFLIK